ncbi:hypothetical protein BASA60_000072 [Batrachochytrium salamandrivorans]|nr:hypothetical protein BASA60_000072 [Batrachochytrium salamandrivorans]KAH9268480.1 hypothetical protein BASA83_009323 [Batrachochytrium salamandrivorans]
MKFSVLVAAAMVITSVSAAGKEGLGGWFKKGDGMTGSESKANLLEKSNSKSGPSRKSQRSSKGSGLLAKYQEMVESSQQQPKSEWEWDSVIHRDMA